MRGPEILIIWMYMAWLVIWSWSNDMSCRRIVTVSRVAPWLLGVTSSYVHGVNLPKFGPPWHSPEMKNLSLKRLIIHQWWPQGTKVRGPHRPPKDETCIRMVEIKTGRFGLWLFMLETCESNVAEGWGSWPVIVLIIVWSHMSTSTTWDLRHQTGVFRQWVWGPLFRDPVPLRPLVESTRWWCIFEFKFLQQFS